MTITFDIPERLEEDLRAEGQDPNRAAKEAFFVELYREGRLSAGQVADALDLTGDETDGLLKKHGALLQMTDEEVQEELRSLRELLVR